MVRCGVAWYGMDMVWYGMVWTCCGMVWLLSWYGKVLFGMVIGEVWNGVVQYGILAWYIMVWYGLVIGKVWLGERWYAPLPSSSQLIRLRRPAELPEYIYPRITEPSLHASLASSLSPTFSYLSH